MAIDPEAPRQTGRYAVVMAGDTFRARYAVGRPEVVLLAAPSDEQPPAFELDPQDSSWTRTVTWDDVQRIFEVKVWWRLDGYPVVERERDSKLVLVETSDGSPFWRSTARRPRALERTGGAGTYSGWVKDTSLADRREVEIELDPESFRTPAGDGPGRPRRAILGKRTRRILDNAWEVVDFVGDILP